MYSFIVLFLGSSEGRRDQKLKQKFIDSRCRESTFREIQGNLGNPVGMFDKQPRSKKSVFLKRKLNSNRLQTGIHGQHYSRAQRIQNQSPFFAFQVLEYHPKNQSWVTIGNLVEIRGEGHAVLSIGPQDVLDCLAGKKPLEMNQQKLISFVQQNFQFN